MAYGIKSAPCLDDPPHRDLKQMNIICTPAKEGQAAL